MSWCYICSLASGLRCHGAGHKCQTLNIINYIISSNATILQGKCHDTLHKIVPYNFNFTYKQMVVLLLIPWVDNSLVEDRIAWTTKVKCKKWESYTHNIHDSGQRWRAIHTSTTKGELAMSSSWGNNGKSTRPLSNSLILKSHKQP